MRNLAIASIAVSVILLSGAATAAPITPITSIATDNQSLVTQVRRGGCWGHRGGWGHRGWRGGGWGRRGWYGRRVYRRDWFRGMP